MVLQVLKKGILTQSRVWTVSLQTVTKLEYILNKSKPGELERLWLLLAPFHEEPEVRVSTGQYRLVANMEYHFILPTHIPSSWKLVFLSFNLARHRLVTTVGQVKTSDCKHPPCPAHLIPPRIGYYGPQCFVRK